MSASATPVNECPLSCSTANGQSSTAPTTKRLTLKPSFGAKKPLRIVFAANEDKCEEFYALIDQFELENPGSIWGHQCEGGDQLCIGNSTEGDLVQTFDSKELNKVASSLLRLAEFVEGAEPDSDRSQLTNSKEVGIGALALSKVAARLQREQEVRKNFLPSSMTSGAAWHMLLELYCQYSAGSLISTKSLSIASGAPESTAHRIITQLGDFGLASRKASATDKRVVLISLTKEGINIVGQILKLLR